MIFIWACILRNYAVPPTHLITHCNITGVNCFPWRCQHQILHVIISRLQRVNVKLALMLAVLYHRKDPVVTLLLHLFSKGIFRSQSGRWNKFCTNENVSFIHLSLNLRFRISLPIWPQDPTCTRHTQQTKKKQAGFIYFGWLNYMDFCCCCSLCFSFNSLDFRIQLEVWRNR